jgi:hypothetical protein
MMFRTFSNSSENQRGGEGEFLRVHAKNEAPTTKHYCLPPCTCERTVRRSKEELTPLCLRLLFTLAEVHAEGNPNRRGVNVRAEWPQMFG